jgi:predicted nuclease of predicted toxin-antitoxin system
VRFLLDHDVPETIARVLARVGHEVNLLREVLPVDAKDVQVLALAAQRGLVLVTCNRDDFLELANKQPHAGIIIIVRRRTRAAECAALLRLLRAAGDSGILGSINFA